MPLILIWLLSMCTSVAPASPPRAEPEMLVISGVVTNYEDKLLDDILTVRHISVSVDECHRGACQEKAPIVFGMPLHFPAVGKPPKVDERVLLFLIPGGPDPGMWQLQRVDRAHPMIRDTQAHGPVGTEGRPLRVVDGVVGELSRLRPNRETWTQLEPPLTDAQQRQLEEHPHPVPTPVASSFEAVRDALLALE